MKRIVSITISICALFGLGLAYQNCGDVRLNSFDTLPIINSSSESLPVSFLPPPNSVEGELRVVFFVDMSRSMLAGTCGMALDALPGQNCMSPQFAVDPDAERADLIINWLRQTRTQLAERAGRLKVMIVPFSGGRSEGYLGYTRIFAATNINFKSVDDAIFQAEAIKAIQTAEELKAFGDFSSGSPDPRIYLGNAGVVMTTSVPGPPLDTVQQKINTEIRALRTSNQIENARFELVLLSDGVPKPRFTDMRNGANAIWGVLECRVNPNGSVTRGVNYNHCSGSCGSLLEQYMMNPGMSMSEVCQNCYQGLANYTCRGNSGGNFVDDARYIWGDANENQIGAIFNKINNVQFVFRSNPDVQYRMNFIQIHPEKVVASENLVTNNWMVRARDILNTNSRHFQMTNATPPASMFPSLSNNDSYRLGVILVINLNARVGPNGQLRKDSDADGVFDDDEALYPSLNISPMNARSNGYCLDGIRTQHGCIIQNCDPMLDQDGDGLNECEEMTVGSDRYNFDSDGDGIPDGLEVVLGSSPTTNDTRTDSNQDGQWNFYSLARNAHPMAQIEDVPPQMLVNLMISFDGYRPITLPTGQSGYQAGYQVGVQSLPLITSLRVSNSQPLKVNNISTDRWDHILTAGNHAANHNNIIVLIRADSVQNPGQFYWLYNKFELKPGDSIPAIDLGALTHLRVNGGGGM